MYRHSIIALLFLACPAIASQAQPKPGLSDDDPTFAEARLKAQAARRWMSVAQYGDARIDVRYYDFHFVVSPHEQTIEADVHVVFRLQEPAASVSFQLSDSLQITSLRWTDGGDLPHHRPGDDTVELAPTKGFGGGEHRVSFTYHGTPPSTGLGSFVFAEIRGFDAVWTLSQPFGASDWFPTNNVPADKVDSVRVSANVPKPLVMASNGLLKETVDLGSTRTFVWESKYPIAPYLISLAIAPYAEFTLWHVSADGDSLPIVNYAYPNQDVETLKTAARQTLGLMSLFTELYGPYPFADEKYGHAQFGRGGGMEHQTLSSMNNWGYFLMAHELAHQWLGDAVTGRTWQDLWIQEGFASLSEGMALEHHASLADFRSWLDVRRDLVTAQPDGSVYIPASAVEARDVSRMFSSRLTYLKSAWVLHMLRRKIGDEAFFGAVRTYISSLGGVADTEDFRDVMETAHGASLERFFDDWVYGEGYPMLHVDTQPVPGQTTVRLTVQQNGSFGDRVFEFPLDIAFKRAEGDTVITVAVSESMHEFYVDPKAAFYAVEIDPHVNLLHGNLLLTSLDEDGIQPELPFSFEAPYPNPFNPAVTIPVQLHRSGWLEADVIDVKGAKVAEIHRGQVAAGRFEMRWEAHAHAAGTYYVRARLGADTRVIPVTLVK